MKKIWGKLWEIREIGKYSLDLSLQMQIKDRYNSLWEASQSESQMLEF